MVKQSLEKRPNGEQGTTLPTLTLLMLIPADLVMEKLQESRGISG